MSRFPPICSSVCCWCVSFDFWKCLESVDKLLHFIGQATSSHFSRSQSPSSSLHTSGKYLHIGINIYNIYHYLQVSLSVCPRELRCIRHKVHIGLFIAFGLADLAWLCQLLCQVSVYIYYIYLSSCLSIYISTWLGCDGPSARCPDISTFTRQIASNRQSLAIKPRLISHLISSSPSVGENVYLSSMQCQCSTDIFSWYNFS